MNFVSYHEPESSGIVPCSFLHVCFLSLIRIARAMSCLQSQAPGAAINRVIPRPRPSALAPLVFFSGALVMPHVRFALRPRLPLFLRRAKSLVSCPAFNRRPWAPLLIVSCPVLDRQPWRRHCILPASWSCPHDVGGSRGMLRPPSRLPRCLLWALLSSCAAPAAAGCAGSCMYVHHTYRARAAARMGAQSTAYF